MPLNRVCKKCRKILNKPTAYCRNCGTKAPGQAEIFISYTHADGALLDELVYQLSVFKREDLATIWHDQYIIAGSDIAAAIDEKLNTADIILLLVSSNYIASNACYPEMECALERNLRKEAYTIPIIMRPVDWTRTPFRSLFALPKDGKPVNIWSNRDQALLDVVQGVRKTIEQVFA